MKLKPKITTTNRFFEISDPRIHLELIIHLTDEQLYQLCQANRDVRFERTAAGKLIVMPPIRGETGDRNAKITFQLRA